MPRDITIGGMVLCFLEGKNLAPRRLTQRLDMLRRTGVGIPISFALVVLVIVGCARPRPPQPTVGALAYRPPRTYSVLISNIETLDECKNLAVAGNAEAAMQVGDAYTRGVYPLPRFDQGGMYPSQSIQPDLREAVYWYARAADLGYVPAMRKLFDAYYFGEVPKNDQKAEEYLLRAAGAGAQWAQLLLASRLEKSDPLKALSLYLTLGRADNCHAQARLAKAYYEGDLAPRNLTKAYFWLLLAKAGEFMRKSESHPAYQSVGAVGLPDFCPRVIPFEFALEGSLTADQRRVAQGAASNWKPGQLEPSLPTSAGIAEPTTPGLPESKVPVPGKPPRSAVPPTVAVAPGPTAFRWTPLPESAWRSRLSTLLDPVRLFEVASQSVWLVFAARSTEELKRASDVALGSAVAVTSKLLLTNCHIIEGRPLVWIKQGEKVERAEVAFGDSQSDRCILSVGLYTLTPIQGMRPYDDLKVGEEVYTIGSPSGLEATLGQGVISGLRRIEQQRLLQTSAPISPGSSGGGLFDKSGNLIGVTTFRLREGQNLNFAIAVEDYFQ